MGNPKGYSAPTDDRGNFVPVEPEVRLRRKFEQGSPDSCWPWLAGVGQDGYGRFWDGTRVVQAHRAVYELLVGEVPEGLTLDHTCHNDDEVCHGGPCEHRRCVNPGHMETVNAEVNKKRGKSPPALNARKTSCVNGHPLVGENVIVRRNGWRQCRICTYESNRRGAARRRPLR